MQMLPGATACSVETNALTDTELWSPSIESYRYGFPNQQLAYNTGLFPMQLLNGLKIEEASIDQLQY